MKDEYRTKGQLIDELKELRQRVDKLEKIKTGRKRSEQALQQEHNLLSRIMETSPAGITVVNKQGNIIFANPQAEQVLGLTKDEITQRAYNDPEWRITACDGSPFPDEDLPFQRVMTGREPIFDVRHAIEWPTGRRRLLSINAAPLFDDSGKFDGMVATVEDITERVRTEKELQESEGKYKKLVEESLQGIVIAQGLPPRFIFVNSVMAEILGYSTDELMSLSPEEVKEIIHPEDQAIFFQRYRDRLEGRQSPSRYEIRGMRKDGTIRWGEFMASRIEYQGKPAAHATFVDITERKQAEAKLKESEHLYRTLTENSLTGIYMFREGYYLFANETYCKIVGYSWDDLKSMDPLDLIAPECREQISERVKKRLAGEDVFSDYETQIIRKDGTICDGQLKATRIMYEGKPTVLGNIIDITERKRVAAALRESEEKYRLVVENAKEAIFVSQDGMIKFINRETEEITGYSSEELTSRPFTDFVHSDDQGMVLENHQKRLRGEALPPVYPFRIVDKDGKTKWVEANAVVITWNGRPATLNFLRDITERKRTENLIRTQDDLILALSAATGLDEGLRLSVDAALQVSGLDCGGVYLVDETSGALDLVFHKGLSPDFVRTVSHFDADSINARIVMTGKPTYTEYPRLGVPLDEHTGHEGLRAIAVLPVRHENRVIGCLNVASHILAEVPVFSCVALEAIAAQIGSSITRLKAEEALKASEDKYRTLVESSTDAIMMMDEERRIVSCNRAFLSLFGYARNEIEGKSIRVIHPSDNSFNTFGDLAYPAIDEVGFFRAEWNFVRKDGLSFPAETVTSAMKSPDRLTIGFVAIIRDLTERKRAEEALQKSEQEAKQLAQENAIMAEIGRIISSTLEIGEVYEQFAKEVNKLIPFDRIVISIVNLENGTGVSTYIAGKGVPDRQVDIPYSLEDTGIAEMVRIKSTLLVQTEDINEVKDRFPRLLSTFQAGFRSIMNVPLFAKGQIIGGLLLRSVQSNAYKIKDVQLAERVGSQIAGAIVNAQLFTGRKRAEVALRESEEKYRSLVANATDAIFIVQDGRIKFPNPITLTLVGYSQEELAILPFVNLIHPEDQAMVLDNYSRRLKGEEVPSTYTFRVVNKGGEELWGQLNAVLITWEGRPAILCFIRDITPQKRLEAQYLHAQKMEAVGTLAGGIAHDFNNLLQAILGYAELLLLDKGRQEPGYQELQEIKRAAQRGGELTYRLLTFSRRVQSELRSVNLNQEVNQIQRLLQRTIPKMIDIELNLADDLRTINGDPAQIEQALMNLALNARDAMPEGGRLRIGTKNVTLDEEYCRMHLGVKAGDYVLLSVTDTGYGMNKEILGHLFEPFYTTKGVGRGTGLGLSMVYGIVRSHDGYISCDSVPGKGTTFEIYLPVIEQRPGMEESKEERIPRGGKETILLIDDEESIRHLGNQILRQFGYTVLTASDGESGLELYQKEKGKIDLVILDLIMPGMGGRRCLEELLRMNPKVKVVIASGYSVDGHTQEALEAGAKNSVSKPYAIRQMLKVVRDVLDKNE